MAGIVALLQAWVAGAERLAGEVPGLAARLAPGSWPLALAVAAAGFGLLLAGVRVGRVLAAVFGALAGWLAGELLAGALHEVWPAALPPWILPLLGAACVAIGSFIQPAAYPAVLLAIPAAMMGGQFSVLGRPMWGAVAGAVLGVGLGVALRRLVIALTASVAGAVLVAVALLALGRELALFAIFRERPVVLAALAAVLAIAGAAFQVGRRPGAGGGRAPPPRPLRKNAETLH